MACYELKPELPNKALFAKDSVLEIHIQVGCVGKRLHKTVTQLADEILSICL